MTDTPNRAQKRMLRAHFAFAKLPFKKTMWARHMFDSQGQRELFRGLGMWTEVRGIALVTGPSGVGKSITLRRFIAELDDSRHHVIQFTYLCTTPVGFLRSLSRALGLRMRLHGADLFDAALTHLATYEAEHGAHPVVVIDDAEGLSVAILDLLRRLTTSELDAEDRLSILLAGTEELLRTLRHPQLEPLRSRIGYAHALRPFSLEDTRNYIRFHLARAEADPKLFTDDAVKQLFHATHGKPRHTNQLALGALIHAAVQGREAVDGRFMADVIAGHPLYQAPPGAQS